MIAIKYDTKEKAIAADASRLSEYKSKVDNVNATLFSSIFEFEGDWYTQFADAFEEYYSEEEIGRVEEIILPEGFEFYEIEEENDN